MRGRQLPSFLHEAPVFLRVKQLWPVILLDVHGRPAFILELLFLQDLHLHTERWRKTPPGAFPGGVFPLFEI